METVLYAQPYQSASPRNQNNQSDEAIYSQGSISVSRTRLMIGSATYAIAAISSLRVVAIPASKQPLLFSILGTIIFPVLPNLFLDNDSTTRRILSGGLFAFGIFTVVVSIKKMKAKFGLRITTSAQEQQILIGPNIQSLHPVESAIHQAISMRG